MSLESLYHMQFPSGPTLVVKNGFLAFDWRDEEETAVVFRHAKSAPALLALSCEGGVDTDAGSCSTISNKSVGDNRGRDRRFSSGHTRNSSSTSGGGCGDGDGTSSRSRGGSEHDGASSACSVARDSSSRPTLQVNRCTARAKCSALVQACACPKQKVVSPAAAQQVTCPGTRASASLEIRGGLALENKCVTEGSESTSSKRRGVTSRTPLASEGITLCSQSTDVDIACDKERGCAHIVHSYGSNRSRSNSITEVVTRLPSQPNTVTRFVCDEGSVYRYSWTLDASKLKGRERQAVSPPFEIPMEPIVNARLVLYPKANTSRKGGSSFKNSGGWGSLHLKCEASIGTVTFLLSIGNGNVEPQEQEHEPQQKRKSQLQLRQQCLRARGPVTCDLALNNMCCLPKGDELWDFSKAVDTATGTFTVSLHLIRDSSLV
eukprot:TRINITY_DN68349_c0_g1_i1.p1 TRINITY_DN68349_c0_g1~~TRINITY_DN68349_c0_g1_i1.p1  ORF type:complete len:434 (+),score=73.27 TRINITY_DN68349_c0_g1_i1:63-1364(+)